MKTTGNKVIHGNGIALQKKPRIIEIEEQVPGWMLDGIPAWSGNKHPLLQEKPDSLVLGMPGMVLLSKLHGIAIRPDCPS